MTNSPNRQPAGTPAGGRFAPTSRPEADADLDGPSTAAPPIDVGEESIWGTVDFAKHVAPGITQVVTSSHGGYVISPERNQRIDPAWRDQDGCYEEDCDWSVVVLTFPGEFSADDVAAADSCARRWHEDAYRFVREARSRAGGRSGETGD